MGINSNLLKSQQRIGQSIKALNTFTFGIADLTCIV